MRRCFNSVTMCDVVLHLLWTQPDAGSWGELNTWCVAGESYDGQSQNFSIRTLQLGFAQRLNVPHCDSDCWKVEPSAQWWPLTLSLLYFLTPWRGFQILKPSDASSGRPPPAGFTGPGQEFVGLVWLLRQFSGGMFVFVFRLLLNWGPAHCLLPGCYWTSTLEGLNMVFSLQIPSI